MTKKKLDIQAISIKQTALLSKYFLSHELVSNNNSRFAFFKIIFTSLKNGVFGFTLYKSIFFENPKSAVSLQCAYQINLKL